MIGTKFKLNNGIHIPAVGIGCWMGSPGEGEHVTRMVKRALEIGYRHIDTAANYGNESSVGKALRETSVSREDIFVTTKLDQADHGRVSEALDESLTKLGLDYVDLYLMHWPMTWGADQKLYLQPEEKPTIVDTWKAMEELLKNGKAKSIGVSNFSVKTLAKLLEASSVIPAVNQVELHPALPQHELLSHCKNQGIHVTAYSPIGKNKLSSQPDVVKIAEAHKITTAQVLLSWGVQRGTSVVPKSQNESRLAENIELVELSQDEMSVLDALHKIDNMHRSLCGYHSMDLNGCFGWTYGQLGWNMTRGGVVKA